MIRAILAHMRAVVQRAYGDVGVLRVEEVPRPEPKEGELLVRVRAAECTKSDTELRGFRFPVKWFWLPLRLAMGMRRPRRPVLGIYFAGVVEAVGAGVDRFAPGDEVFGSTGMRQGAHAEWVCLPESSTLVEKPRNLSFEEAAAVPLGGWNALHFMNLAEIQPGEQVLIIGAGGSIGSFAVQIARARGAVVTAVDKAEKAALLRELGAAQVIDYETERFHDLGPRFEVVLNMVAGTPLSRCLSVLKPGGRYLNGNPRLLDLLRAPWVGRLTDKRAFVRFARESEEELLTLKRMCEAGEIHPVLDRVLPLESAAEAHERVETETRQGIVVLSPLIGG